MSSPTNGHALEATVLSMTDTIVEPAERSGNPSFRSEVTAVNVNASPTSASAPPSLSSVDAEKGPHALPAVIPPQNAHRCLILCFDGTGDQFDADNSNIVQLMSALKKDDRTKQMVYYQSGIGTYTSAKFASPATSKLSLTLDTMIAWNLDTHVMGGYEFLMQNYTANDRICIFGFSRGAYIARSLAGMIHKVGLLPVDNHQQVPFAYRMYTRADATGWAQSNAFKKAFSNDVNIDFVGVWDTVDSVGLIPKRLPFTTSNTIVRAFRHAVSLDERRAKFKANLWNWPSDQEKKLGTHPKVPKPVRPKYGYTLPFTSLPTHFKTSSEGEADDEPEQAKFEKTYAKPRGKTDVLEVWFAGCHCDVGGGSVQNDTRHSLARIPLRWMVRECFKADTGIMFDTERLHELGLDPATLYPFVLERPPPLPVGDHKIERAPRTSLLSKAFSRRRRAPAPESEPASPVEKPTHGMEEEEELRDALSPIYDQLACHRFWWILELIPMNFRYQRRDDTWVTDFRANLGRARKIPHQRPPDTPLDHPEYQDHKPAVGLKVHRSVAMRRAARDDRGRPYINRAHFHCEPEWVD
ncbi:hypothetical protein B0H10DRAFT_2013024 [Mycena sp. CBHHK59/15]|nr:hypothetical protein B0H10DRAFT_2013024 [Mycena sp. CBHHK59/15]